MAISFEKNQAELIAAWKDVLDDKSTTNWALFAYEGQSNELKVFGTGEGGLDELCEDLNSSKIMYAFVCVEDPKTTLKKFLLINWQGEGAPVLRKRACANHMPDVIKMFHGAHLTVNARNEDDIDLERLLNKLNTTGSTYSFKEPRKNAIDIPKAPVGTNYTRCIPTKELNISVMQDFWKNEEKEEKHRIAIEREQKRLQQAKLEQEQRAREEKEYLERENRIRINKLQPAHVPIKTSPQPLSPDKTTASIFQSRVVNDIERMREQRSQEARDLIGSRVLAAKAIFTKYTSEGQLQTKLNSVPPAKPIRNSISQRINVLNQFRTENSSDSCQLTSLQNANENINVNLNLNDKENKLSIKPINTERNDHCEISKEYENRNEFVIDGGRLEPVKPEMTAIANNDDGDDESHNLDDYPLEPDAEQFSTIKRSPHSKSNSLQSPAETSSSNNNHTALYQDDDNEREVLRTKVSVIVQQSQCQSHIPSKNGYLCALTNTNQIDDLVNEDDFICQDGNLGDLGLKACALYDYKAADESEITFDPGDIITHVDRIDEGWWQGYGPDGTYGLFPANYVEIID